MSTSAPSGTLEELAAVVGMAGAHALANLFGGTRQYIPKEPTPELVKLLGEAFAARLTRHFDGAFFEVPKPDVAGARRAWVLRLRAEGLFANEIALRVGLTRRRVCQILFAEADEGSVSPVIVPGSTAASD